MCVCIGSTDGMGTSALFQKPLAIVQHPVTRLIYVADYTGAVRALNVSVSWNVNVTTIVSFTGNIGMLYFAP